MKKTVNYKGAGGGMEHIWTLENWEKNFDLMDPAHRTGLRLLLKKMYDAVL